MSNELNHNYSIGDIFICFVTGKTFIAIEVESSYFNYRFNGHDLVGVCINENRRHKLVLASSIGKTGEMFLRDRFTYLRRATVAELHFFQSLTK